MPGPAPDLAGMQRSLCRGIIASGAEAAMFPLCSLPAPPQSRSARWLDALALQEEFPRDTAQAYTDVPRLYNASKYFIDWRCS